MNFKLIFSAALLFLSFQVMAQSVEVKLNDLEESLNLFLESPKTIELKSHENDGKLFQLNLQNDNNGLHLEKIITINLPNGEEIVALKQGEDIINDVFIWKGRKQTTPEGIVDVQFYIDLKTYELSSSINHLGKTWDITFDQASKFYRIVEIKSAEERGIESCSDESHIKHSKATNTIPTPAKKALTEQDCFGVSIIDVFVGFSNSAAQNVGNINTKAVQMINEVNTVLANTNINNVRVRLVGTGTNTENRGVVTSIFQDAEQWYQSEIEQYQPDMIALVQTPGGNDIGGGVADGVPSYMTVNSTTNLINVFRHEIGHSAGSWHCTGEVQFPYRAYGHGIDAGGGVKTCMCGNTIAYYSNPNLVVSGRTIGNVNTADNARIWNDRAVQMASRKIHSIPYDCEDNVGCVENSACDDNDPCTYNDSFDSNCDCVGIFQDFDNDGVCYADENCTEIYVSDLNPVFGSQSNGYGPIEFDMSNGGTAANDGGILTINGRTYAKGLGVHANSSIEYNISGAYDRLIGFIGVNDNCQAVSTIRFLVYGDGSLLYQSPIITFETEATLLNVDLQNVNTLRLVVNDAGDGISCDHGNWADLKLVDCVDCTVGATCNDNDPCTTNDAFDNNCNCQGTLLDSDNDGVCNAEDVCPNFDDSLIGSSCDDGDSCTTGEKYDSSCNCSGGVFQDFDNDGICDADEDCTDTFVSDLNPIPGSETNGFGPIEIDMSNGGIPANDGEVLTINGLTYAKGLGVHADSSIEYDIDGSYELLAGFIGVNDNCQASSSIQFQVFGDNNILYQSPVMTFEDDAIAISIDVQNVNILRLVVNDAGDGITCDHGNWADLKLIDCVDCISGGACNDNDPCTTNDIFDSNCDCVGTYTDSDNDNVCDANDACPGFSDSLIGTSCNDGDPCTTGEVYSASCICSGGVFQDSDNDGVCDYEDVCEGGDDTVDTDGDGIPDFCDNCNINNGTSCDDGDSCTVNDVFTNCDCTGTFQDSDNDGVCDDEDICAGGDDSIDTDGDGIPDFCDNCNTVNGTVCDDGDSCTVNDVFINCNCTGTFQDSDNDGVCDDEDICAGGDDSIDTDADGTPDFCDNCNIINGTNCDDGDLCTVNDVFTNCNCVGTFQDTDNDGVCDDEDICMGGDDSIDTDGDGIPDFCDNCNVINGTVCDDGDPCTVNDVYTNCNCGGSFQDSDNDSICDADDICTGGDDTIDTDGDGTPDFCDTDCETLVSDGFESNAGLWMIGGSDAALIMSSYSPGGEYSMRIRDNSFDASAIYTQSLDLAGQDPIQIHFAFQAIGMETGEDFFLEISTDGGNTFTIIEDWISGTDFDNEIIYNETIDISPQFISTSTVIKFRCDASINSDEVYLDNIRIESCAADTECEDYILETQNVFLNNSRSAILGIETNGIIQSASDIEYTAGNYVLLKEGFEVKPLASFHAYIEACQD